MGLSFFLAEISIEENLEQLVELVDHMDCDFGIAFDGDGDRIGVVDDKGRILFGDQLMALFAEEVLASHPKATIIADVKTSQRLFFTTANPEKAGQIASIYLKRRIIFTSCSL